MMIKGRNEPCNVIQVCQAVAAILGITEKELADAAYKNTLKMFNL